MGTIYRPRRTGGRGWLLWLVGVILVSGAVTAGWHFSDRLLGSPDDQIVIQVTTTPPEAKVFLDGAQVLPPFHLQRTNLAFTILVSAEGYQSRVVTIRAERDHNLAITLSKARIRPRRRSSTRSAKGVSGSRRCPPSMQQIPGADGAEGFCVDRHEYPGRGRPPRRGVSLAAARAACHSRGTRLCSVEEWTRACGGRRFPYGETYQRGRCSTGGKAPRPAGSRRGCRSRWGVYDLSGNVSEWVSDGVTMGGDASQERGLTSCWASSPGGGPLAGFRCCADIAWD
jgi:formylglycine-generating enzyme required for sulfatase activity